MGAPLHTRERSGIRLDAEGQFWHDDEKVEHPGVLRAFHQGVSRADDGRYTLRFGSDWCFIEVEDAPYQVLSVTADSSGFSLRLDDATRENVGANDLRHSPEGVLYARVKGAGMLARFSRPAQASLYDLLDLDDRNRFTIRLGTVVTPIAALESGR